MSPGAGAELKHLMNGVKSKAAKSDDDQDLKPKSEEAEALNLKDASLDLQAKTLNIKVLGEAVKGANTNRQSIGVWSPKISAVLWYLKKTTPEFSISDEARTILEEGLQKKYPELYQKVKEEMGQL